MAWVLLPPDNEGQDKRVESIWVPCLDAGSTPAISTGLTAGNEKKQLTLIFNKTQLIYVVKRFIYRP